MELKEIIKNEYKKRPHMEVLDYLKLIYQNEFGAAHIGFCEVQSKESILEEWGCPINDDEEVYEYIGNGIGRANIGKIKEMGISMETFSRIFSLSGRGKPGKDSEFLKKAEILKECAESKEIPLSAKEIDVFLEYMEERDFSPVSHSMGYKVKYNPHYRLVRREIAKYFEVFAKIDNILSEKGKIIIGIDGRCGAGKSCLAEILAFIYKCDIVHMDDFFLPEELKNEKRLSEAGGNIHYERFEKEAAEFLGKSFSYKPYSCKDKSFGKPVSIRKSPVTIVEGVYALSPKIYDKYDLKIFLDIKSDLQKERIIQRSGEKMWDKFEKIWIPMEEKYFSELGIKNSCDFYFNEQE